jgi:2-phosphosulfolactate phosphatase
MSFTDQRGYDARFEWGEAGLRALAPGASTIVIVDVLSFTTAVDVALSGGSTVIPYCWRDDSAAEIARQHDAFLAVSRRRVDAEHPYSLSPQSLQQLPAGSRIVLPSPNGATLSSIADELGATVIAGCLRNASAVARACRAIGGPVLVIAAGERWSDVTAGSLRPALEDLLGAGAILTALGAGSISPEASAAIAAFEEARPNVAERIARSASGRELIESGFAGDVEIAAGLDVSATAAILRGGCFTAA